MRTILIAKVKALKPIKYWNKFEEVYKIYEVADKQPSTLIKLLIRDGLKLIEVEYGEVEMEC